MHLNSTIRIKKGVSALVKRSATKTVYHGLVSAKPYCRNEHRSIITISDGGGGCYLTCWPKISHTYLTGLWSGDCIEYSVKYINSTPIKSLTVPVTGEVVILKYTTELGWKFYNRINIICCNNFVLIVTQVSQFYYYIYIYITSISLCVHGTL